ncbi:MAG: hypothetical protein ACI8PZ_006062 [Myxococcota bacterium]|jgi:hypothetical protein
MSPPPAVLIVAVDDYRTYDASLGNPVGTSDLHGAVNDAAAWYAAVRAMGVPVDRIRIVASPKLTKGELGGESPKQRRATRAGIERGVRWLAKRAGRDGATQALFTWSGHGALLPEGPALCPADTEGGELDNAILYTDIEARLEQHAPQSNVTVVLDTCHVGAAGAGIGRLRHAGRRGLVHSALPASIPISRVRPGDPVLSAALLNQTSQEWAFDGVVHGALTWAATTVLHRWGTSTDDGITWYDITYRSWLARIRSMLATLDFHQTPNWDSDGTAFLELPVLHPTTSERILTDAPDDSAGVRELHPDTALGYSSFRITTLDGSSNLGWAISVGDQNVTVSGNTWTKDQEYWIWQSGSAFPTSGFRLKLATAPSSGLSPSAASVYENKPFPTTTSTYSVTSGTWFDLSQGASGSYTTVGYLKVKNSKNDWYEQGTATSANAWITLTGSQKLKFTHMGTDPTTLVNVSFISTDLLSSPQS